MKTADAFYQEMQDIVNDKHLDTKEKIEQMSVLLSNMATEFDIPLIYDENYKKRNIEVMKIFESIVKEISKLQIVQ